MTVALALGLLLEATAVALVLAALRGSAFRRAGPYLLFSMVVFHGLTELLQIVTGDRLPQRSSIPQRYLDQWIVTVGAACAIYAVIYIAVIRRQATTPPTDEQTVLVQYVYDWRILAVFSLPLVAIVAGGKYQVSTVNTVDVAQAGLAGQFFTLSITLTTISFVAKHPRWFLPAFLLEMALEVVLGQRLDVVTGGITTLAGLAILGLRPRWRSVIASGLIALFVVLSLNAARAQYGRQQYAEANSLPARLSLVVHGAAALVQNKPAQDPLATQPLAVRIDGNTFAAGELYALDNGAPSVGLSTLRNDLYLAVPSALDPDKLSTPVQERSEKTYLQNNFDLNYAGDFIPTQLGSALGYYGPIGLLIVAALLAVGFGLADRATLRRLTPWTYILTIGLMTVALSYESSNDVYTLTARGVAVAYIVMTVLAVYRLRYVKGTFGPRATTRRAEAR